ncbi:PaaI family thioesterase [Paracoccaceae bacterium GXU_MW_L88]
MSDKDAIMPRVAESFAKQKVMETLGATLVSATDGRVEIALPFNPDFTQQHGFLHAGTVATVLDSACGYAGFSVMPEDAAVLTAEFKINLLAPADGQSFHFVGEVVKPGRTLVIAQGTAFAEKDGKEKAIAIMTATLAVVQGRGLSG